MNDTSEIRIRPHDGPSSRSLSRIASEVLQRGEVGLRQLLDAYCYATDVARDPWQFALELKILQNGGLSVNELRWLISKGFVEHACEMDGLQKPARKFRKSCPDGLRFGAESCFVLTPLGFGFWRCLRERTADKTLPVNGKRVPVNGNSSEKCGTESLQVTPSWDSFRRELRVAETVVKQFNNPAPNQETILMAFQEEHWPVHIDDPLPPSPESDPKLRLRDTIASLNRKHKQKQRLIRFSGNGCGNGVRYELL